jgi:uncharacterized membrane protein HdeD (DUF308 family)
MKIDKFLFGLGIIDIIIGLFNIITSFPSSNFQIFKFLFGIFCLLVGFICCFLSNKNKENK